MHTTMINHNGSCEKTKIAFSQAFKSVNLTELLRKTGIRKAQGIYFITANSVLLNNRLLYFPSFSHPSYMSETLYNKHVPKTRRLP